MDNEINNDPTCESVKKKDSVNNVLSELDTIMDESNELLKEIRDYKKNLDTIISTTDNEFLNLSESEISEKLDTILDDVLNSESCIVDSSSNNDCSNLNEFTKKEEVDKEVDNKEVDKEKETDNKEDNNSDCSTINPDDLETESESESDLDEYDSVKIKQKDNSLTDMFDINTLLKSMGELKSMGDVKLNNFEEVFSKMTEIPEFSTMSEMYECPSEENIKKMQSELDNIAPLLKQMTSSLSKMTTQFTNNPDFESLDDFIKNDELEEPNKVNDKNDKNDKNEENEQTNNNSDNNSDTESYYQTDDEESGDELNKEQNTTDNSSVMFTKINSVNKFLSEKTGFNFDMSNVTSMFNLFGSAQANKINSEKNTVNTEPNENNNCCVNDDVNCECNYDEQNNKKCVKSECVKSECVDVNDSNVRLKECLENNKKMMDSLSQMMKSLGMNNLNIEELANLKKNE